MAVQFQSYGGGPHGGGVTIAPWKAYEPLTDIGEFLGNIGQIPNQVQKMQLSNELNNLLLKVLTAPQTEQQTTTTPPVLPRSDNVIGSQSFGSLLSEPQTKTTTVPGTEYKSAMDRLKSVGPAFGFKFPSSYEDAYAIALAKSLGGMPTTEAKIAGQKDIEGLKQEGRQQNIKSRAENKMREIEALEKGRNDRSAAHNKTITDIANDKNKTDLEKTREILAQRKQKWSEELEYLNKTIGVKQSGADSLDEIRKAQMLNGLRDDLRTTLTQIDKIRQLNTPEANTEMQAAVEQYNSIVDKIGETDPGIRLSKMGMENASGISNWLRSLTGGTPTQQPKTVPNTTTPTQPRTTRPAPTPGVTTTPANPGINTPSKQKEIIERLKRRNVPVE